MVLGGWLLTHAAVSYSMARISTSIVRILVSDCSAENDVPVSVMVDSQSPPCPNLPSMLVKVV